MKRIFLLIAMLFASPVLADDISSFYYDTNTGSLAFRTKATGIAEAVTGVSTGGSLTVTTPLVLSGSVTLQSPIITSITSGTGTFTPNTSGAVAVPNVTGTVTVNTATQSLTNKTFDSTSTLNGVRLSSFTPDGTHTLTNPNITDTIVSRTNVETLSNKTISASSNTITLLAATIPSTLNAPTAFTESVAAGNTTGVTATNSASGGNSVTMRPGSTNTEAGIFINDANQLILGSTSVTSMSLNVNNNGTVKLNQYSAGPLSVIAGGNLSTSSDSRLKNEIKGKKGYGLKEVLQLHPRFYKWKQEVKDVGEENATVNLGFFAQEVGAVIPEALGQPAHPGGYYGLQDRPMMAAMIEAIKELKAQNDALTKRLEDAGL